MVNGSTEPFLIVVVLDVSNNRIIMGEFVNGWLTNVLECISLFIMILAAGLLVCIQCVS
jgi:Mn2+/Fe2+ NRAMP family transporter